MKTLKDLTPEIQAKIPEYIKKYTKGVFDGGRYNSFKREDAAELINWNYEKAQFKKPVILVAENPYEAQIFFNYIVANEKIFLPVIYLNYCLLNGIEVPKEILKPEVSSNQLHSQLDSQLRSQLHSQLDSQLRSQLHSQLDSQLRSQLYSQLDSQLYSQLRSQLYSQLHSQLDSQLHSQLDSQLYSQLDSQLYSQLDSQLSSQLRSQLYSQLYSQLDSQLYSQLHSQLRSQLRSQLYSQLDSQLKTHSPDYLFTANVYSLAYAGYFNFLKEEFKLDEPINVMLDSWSNLYQKSGVYSAIFSELVCVVSKFPKVVRRNENNDLHNVNVPAVDWGYSTDLTKFDNYYVNGRSIPMWVAENPTFDQFINEENEDIKAAVITVIKERHGNTGLLKFLKAILVDEQRISHFEGYVETIRLYKTQEKYSFLQDHKGAMNQPYCWSEMKCPSTGSVYLIDNSAAFTNALEAIKFLRPSFIPHDLEYRWVHSAN